MTQAKTGMFTMPLAWFNAVTVVIVMSRHLFGGATKALAGAVFFTMLMTQLVPAPLPRMLPHGLSSASTTPLVNRRSLAAC